MSSRWGSVCSLIALTLLLAMGHAWSVHASDDDIVLYASDVGTIQGNWARESASGAAGGQQMSSVDNGWSSTSTALASPTNYFEASFNAPSATTYHVWLRLRATGNSKWNDSVWVQFNDSTATDGSVSYRIGTTSSLLENLEPCSGCGTNGWGWQDKGYWISQSGLVRFAASGTHTIRVQTREDGVQIDQIVLSPSTYLSSAPGQVSGDSTIVPKPSASAPAPAPAQSPSTSGPYLGTAISLPGVIQAENFDNGPDGVSSHDTTLGNSGGVYRSSNIDIEPSAGGGYDVGWIATGEWMNYAVNVSSSGTYTVQFRTASPSGGGSLQVGFNGPVGVWKPVSIPVTGGWQNWTTVSTDVTLGAGSQLMTLLVNSEGFNLDSITVVQGSGGVPAPGAPNSPNPGDGSASVTVTPSLSWQASGATSFDLRLSTSNPPSLYASNLTNAWTGTSQLSAGTRYYWQIVAKNAYGSTTGPVWSFTTASSTPPSSSTLRVMTWNVRSGTDAGNVYVLPQQVNAMAAQNPDVIFLQEVSVWNEDQPTKYRTLLEQATQRTWYASWAPSTATGGCLGNLILSRIPMASTEMKFSSPSAFARAQIYVNNVPIQLFTNHLDYYDTSVRTRELNDLMSWARSFGGPRLVGGDFNSWWGEWWILQMETEYSDTWRDYTGSNENGYTIGNVRFDYIFRAFDQAWRLTPTGAWVVNNTLSDHRAVVAEFRVQ
jgi:endonuclease/exonuclease/phosphatase family metal-dependent hydrolase